MAWSSEQSQLLQQVLAGINTTLFNACVVGSEANAKDDCIRCIKTMNGLLAMSSESASDKTRLQVVSAYLMQLYGLISEKKLDVQQRFLWLSSRRKGVFYYPVVSFNSEYNSLNCWRDLVQTNTDDMPLAQLEIPDEYSFKQMQITNWNENGTATMYQDLLNDCSYVSSVLSISENADAAGALSKCVVPRASSSLFRIGLFFNGCQRVVVVDNLLPVPVSEHKLRQMMISSVESNDMYWPALIEKAYLQLLLHHGYTDFQGSNMATDTYMLIGWLPEVVKIHLDVLDDKLMNAFQRGEVLLGLGTGTLTDKVCKDLQLVSNHDYSVIAINKDTKELLLKNSWLKHRNLTISGLSNFKYIYVNWNPKLLFRNQSTVTFKYQKCAAFGDQSQFLLDNKTQQKQWVWLLLERHLIDSETQGEDTNDIWININLYDSRTKLLSKAEHLNITRNREINNRLCLLKCVLEPTKKYTVIPESTQSFLFSLHAFNNMDPGLKLEKAPYEKPHTKEIEGYWGPTTLGGPYNMSSYIKNPQYAISFSEKADADIAVFAQDSGIHVNVHIFYCGQDPITKGLRLFDEKTLLLHGSYEQNSTVQSFNGLQVGNYRVVVSNFEGVKGPFKLVINSTQPVTAIPVLQSLGMFMRQCTFKWNNSTRHKLLLKTTDYNNKIGFHLNNYAAGPVTELLQYRPLVRASVFNRFTSQPVFVNESWSNGLYGLFYDWTIDSPGEFILLVELQHASDYYCTIDIGGNKDIAITEISSER